MARVLRNLRIDEVSSVDRGAGRGVKVLMTKRHADGVPELYGKPLAFAAALDAETESYLKREFSADERDAAASSGAALPDGSFPIKNKGDLKNAIQAIGRAKDPAKAKAHIKARARALGATDALPESWGKRDDNAQDGVQDNVIDLAAWVEGLRKSTGVHKDAVDFDEAVSCIQAIEQAGALMHELSEAMCALDGAISSIFADDAVTDKGAAITESFNQFKDHLGDLRKAAAAAANAAEMEKIAMSADNTTLSPAVQKMLDKAIAESVTKVTSEKDAAIAKLADELAVAKMSDKHKAFHAGLSGDEPKRFAAMTPDERDSQIEKTKKRWEDDPIIKQMTAENVELRKGIQELKDSREVELCKHDARVLGLTQTDAGEILMKARRGEAEAFKKIEEHITTLTKQRDEAVRTGKVFVEFGKGGGPAGGGSAGGTTAMDQLSSLATELRKVKPDLTKEQAFAKVMEDPANRELVAQESNERMAKIQGRQAA